MTSWVLSIVMQHLLALHLVSGRADCVPQDAVLLLQSSDLALQLLPHLLELHINKRIQSSCSPERNAKRSGFLHIFQSPAHLYLHGLELLVAALCFALHAAEFFLHGCTLLSHHGLHPTCLLLLDLKLLRRSKGAYEALHRNKQDYSIHRISWE